MMSAEPFFARLANRSTKCYQSSRSWKSLST